MAQGGSFPPQVGHSGSTAVHPDSAIFRDWAVTCDVERGYQRIDNPGAGLTTTGSPNFTLGVTGPSGVLSLGDAGVATLTFTTPFFDGPGDDFVVFENAFPSGEQAFLELAFVEVSSNGIDFVRFPAISEVQTDTQVGFAGITDASYVHNLAGKYIAPYGVPFDLEDLPNDPSVDKTSISHVRIIDVVGSIDPNLGSMDSHGTLINDPWPTEFPTGGFDLNAVGIINSSLPPVAIHELATIRDVGVWTWFSLNGTPIEAPTADHLPTGIYIRCAADASVPCQRVFIP